MTFIKSKREDEISLTIQKLNIKGECDTTKKQPSLSETRILMDP